MYMMKQIKLWPVLAAGLVAIALTGCKTADDDKEVTMTGTMVCAKCKLHEAKDCQNVLQVSDPSGNTVNYYLEQNKVSKDFHSNICMNDGEKATVTGTVEEKDGKEVIEASKIEAAQ
jgi:Family of unknown function (DUF6370)